MAVYIRVWIDTPLDRILACGFAEYGQIRCAESAGARVVTLYVLGNGFDLWHELPTSYDRFYAFAKDILDEIEDYYSFNVAQKGPWCDFENSLARFDWRSFYEAHDNTDVTAEDFRQSEVYGLEDDLTAQADNHVTTVKERFQEWIETIDISGASKKLSFGDDDRFFTFNYTATLQFVYGIKNERVFHIHGRSDRMDDLIFGHGESREEEPELDENGDSNRTIFSDAEGAAKYPFYAFQKPVDEVLKENRNRFESQHDVSDIVVIGHSLNEIDLPYFRRLSECAKDARWNVYYYKCAEKEHHVQQLMKCGVPAERIQAHSYSHLQSKAR